MRIFFGLLTMNTENPNNKVLVDKLKSKKKRSSFKMTVLQSVPQFVLQLRTVFIYGTASKNFKLIVLAKN